LLSRFEGEFIRLGLINADIYFVGESTLISFDLTGNLHSIVVICF